MMNSPPTSKIVIGIGIAAVFGIGVSAYVVRAKHESQIAHDAPVRTLGPSDQSAADATAPAQSAPTQTLPDQTPTASNLPPAVQPAAVPPAVAPTPSAPTAPPADNVAKHNPDSRTGDESKPSKASSDRSGRPVARTQNSDDTHGTHVASGSSKMPAGASASPDASSSRPVASDGQITADVKSEIATTAPNSNVDVTTTNGVVALTGSVPSEDAIDRARLAAQRVAGVKHVDASGLTVGNQ